MSIFGFEENSIFNGDGLNDNDLQISDELFESLLIDEASSFTDEQKREFIESDLASILVTEGRMRKNTLVRIGQNDDLERRTSLVSLMLAKEANDPLYKKYREHRVKEKNALAQINKKYLSKSRLIAKKSQKDYIKNRMPKTFTKISDFGVNR